MFKADVKVIGNVISGRQGVAYVFNSGKIKSVIADIDAEQEYADRGYCRWKDVIKVHKDTTRYSLEKVGSLVEELDENKNVSWKITGGGSCLSASFGFEDVLEDAINANLPTVSTDDILAVAQISKKSKIYLISLFKVGSIDINCQVMARLTPLTDEEMKEVVAKINRWVNA